jgi:hypothetical protein
MTNEEKESLSRFFKKIYNVTDEEIASLYNDAGELTTVDPLLTKDSERVARFKQEKSDQFKLGEKKAHQKIESHLKEKYDITDSELIGAELIDFVVEAQTSELKEKLTKKVDPSDIEKHPAFIAKRSEWEKTLTAKDKEWQDKFESRESEWNKKQTLGEVAKHGLTYLETNFVLPEDPQRAANFKNIFARELEAGNYSLQENGDPIILDKDGNPAEDAHGRMISFKDHIDQIGMKYFDKRQANQRGNSGNQNQQNNTQAIVIKDQSEFSQKMAEAKTAEDRAAIMSAAKTAGIV